MKVLIACEFSGIVRDAFLARGHNAISCDILPSERPGPHIQGDIREVDLSFFDIMIAFPPCTYLSYAGIAHWNKPGRKQKREEALDFVGFLMNAPVAKIAIENPRGCIQEEIRKSDQIIQPWMFGHSEMKQTHLWLKNLPPLMATCVMVGKRKEFVNSMPGTGQARQLARSKTFDGIANAMSEQWG